MGNGTKKTFQFGGATGLVGLIGLVVYNMFGPGGIQSQQTAQTAAHAVAIDNNTRRIDRQERAYDKVMEALAEQQKQLTRQNTLLEQLDENQGAIMDELGVVRQNTNRAVGWIANEMKRKQRRDEDDNEVRDNDSGDAE